MINSSEESTVSPRLFELKIESGTNQHELIKVTEENIGKQINKHMAD